MSPAPRRCYHPVRVSLSVCLFPILCVCYVLVLVVLTVACPVISEKSRANAAGALGNLARHSDSTVPVLVRHKAVETLLQLAVTTEELLATRRNVAHENGLGVSSQRIALFSLGNLCAHAACRKVLLAADGRARLQLLAGSSSDSKVRQYAQRALRKLTKP